MSGRWKSRALCGVAVALFGISGEARAELKVCNQTLNLYNVAIGTVVAEGEVETEGWWTLAANSCVSPVRTPLANRYYYLYASDIHGDDAVTGKTELCVNKQQFLIRKIDPERPACWQRGLIQVKFQEIDTKQGSEDWTVFIEVGGGAE